MGAYSFDGIDDYLEVGSVPVTAVPLTIGVWARPAAAAAGTLVCIGDKDVSNQHFFAAEMSAGLTGNATAAELSSQSAASVNSGSVGTWHSVEAVFPTNALRYGYLDGGSRGQNTNTRTPAGLDRTAVGRRRNAGAQVPFGGHIGWVFIWNATLADADVAGFHAGHIPRRANLIAAYDLTQDYSATGIVPNLVNPGTHDLTIVGATYDSAQTPPVTYDVDAPGAYKFDGVDDHLKVDSSPISAYPFTMGCWLRPTALATDAVVCLVDKDINTVYTYLGINGAGTIQAHTRNDGGGGSASAFASTNYAAATWDSAVAIFTDTDRDAFRAGGSKGSDGTNLDLGAVDRLSVGVLARAAITSFFTGHIGWVFIWDVELTDAEVADFHAGIVPQEASLVAAYDLTQDHGAGPIPNAVNPGTHDLAITGALFEVYTPPVTYTLGGGGPVVEFDALVAGASSVSTALARIRASDVSIAGLSTLTSQAERIRSMPASVAGLGALQADMARVKALEALIAGDAQVTAAIVGGVANLEALVSGQGVVLADMSMIRAFEADVVGLAEILAGLGVSLRLAAVAYGQAVVVAEAKVGPRWLRIPDSPLLVLVPASDPADSGLLTAAVDDTIALVAGSEDLR